METEEQATEIQTIQTKRLAGQGGRTHECANQKTTNQ